MGMHSKQHILDTFEEVDLASADGQALTVWAKGAPKAKDISQARISEVEALPMAVDDTLFSHGAMREGLEP